MVNRYKLYQYSFNKNISRRTSWILWAYDDVFKKDQETYQCRATEIDTDKPNLSNISIISHDMDHAIENGLTIIVSMA